MKLLYAYYTIRNRLVLHRTKQVILNPIDEYIKPIKLALLETYNSDVPMNTNIHPDIYDMKRFTEILKDESNELEGLWRNRLIRELTPFGEVIMYYDIYKQGFAYYSEQNGIPYAILNAVAMKYVMTFLCRDFFLDEMTITTEKLPNIFNEEEKKVKTAPDREGQPFAKLKNYKNDSVQQSDKEKTKDKERPKLKNKFISLGKTYEFSTIPKRVENNIFTYKDYKNKVRTFEVIVNKQKQI